VAQHQYHGAPFFPQPNHRLRALRPLLFFGALGFALLAALFPPEDDALAVLARPLDRAGAGRGLGF